MAEKIGVLVGWEQSFPGAFIERCNKVPGISAEIAKIGGTPERYRARTACSSTASARRCRTTAST
jgi:hypothetical protein